MTLVGTSFQHRVIMTRSVGPGSWSGGGTHPPPPKKKNERLFQGRQSPIYQRGTFLYFPFFWPHSKSTKTVPLGHHFGKQCLFEHTWGTKQCPFGKWHQNGASKGTILRTIKWCPKGTVLVPLIFLSAGKLLF